MWCLGCLTQYKSFNCWASPLKTVIYPKLLQNNQREIKSYATLLKKLSLFMVRQWFPSGKGWMCHGAKIRRPFSKNKRIFVRLAVKSDLLLLLKCLYQNIHLVFCTDLVKSHFQPPVSWMLESVFSHVWYNLNGSRLSGTIPFFFFLYIIGTQDKC